MADADAKRHIASHHHQHSQGYHHGMHISHVRGDHHHPVEVYKEINDEIDDRETSTNYPTLIIPVDCDLVIL